MLHSIKYILLTASKGTQYNLESTIYFLNYAASNHDTEIIHRTSDMILRVDSDVSYLVTPQDRSRSVAYYYLINIEGTLFNLIIYVLAKKIKMSCDLLQKLNLEQYT